MMSSMQVLPLPALWLKRPHLVDNFKIPRCYNALGSFASTRPCRFSGESRDRMRHLCGGLSLGRQGPLDGGQRLFGGRGLGTASLSHVGAATAPLAAQGLGAAADQLDRIEAPR